GADAGSCPPFARTGRSSRPDAANQPPSAPTARTTPVVRHILGFMAESSVLGVNSRPGVTSSALEPGSSPAEFERDLLDPAGECEPALVLVGGIDRRDRVAADLERLQPVAERRTLDPALAGGLAVDEQPERAA